MSTARFELITQREVYERARDDRALVLELRDVRAVYGFDQRDADIDFTKVMITCPNGATMRMNDWLDARSAELGFDVRPALDDRFTISLEPIEITGCERRCHRCADGAWVCVDTCAYEDDPWDRLGLPGEGPWTYPNPIIPPEDGDPLPGDGPRPGDPIEPDDGAPSTTPGDGGGPDTNGPTQGSSTTPGSGGSSGGSSGSGGSGGSSGSGGSGGSSGDDSYGGSPSPGSTSGGGYGGGGGPGW